jgi:cellulose synthase/poly-beta-1,6-N-acetylglucosamine synthase-like glycosyltransferase
MLSVMLTAIAAIAVPFVVYPVLLWVRAVLSKAPVSRAPVTPEVDLVICAHNEAASIGAKVKNALDLDYPQDKLNIWIASDGSTDETVSVAETAAAGCSRVHLLDLPRTGKAGALISAVQSGRAEVIAFSDANSEWTPRALRNLVAPLADESVGGVAGDQRYDNAEDNGSSGERSYWSFDRMLKRWQAEAGSTVSATGAIYCVRRSLFEAPPPDATDDFMISTGVIAAGRRLAFAADAYAIEPPAATTGLEYQRKVRVISRGLRSVIYRRALLNPARTGLYGVQLFVHKVWRRMVWIPLLTLFCLAPFALFAGGPLSLIAACVLVAVGLGLAGVLIGGLRRFRVVSIPAYILVVNMACLVATSNLLLGRRISSWQLPRRAPDEAGAGR